MQIMTAKTTTLRTLNVQVVLNSAIFPQILFNQISDLQLKKPAQSEVGLKQSTRLLII